MCSLLDFYIKKRTISKWGFVSVVITKYLFFLHPVLTGVSKYYSFYDFTLNLVFICCFSNKDFSTLKFARWYIYRISVRKNLDENWALLTSTIKTNLIRSISILKKIYIITNCKSKIIRTISSCILTVFFFKESYAKRLILIILHFFLN